MLHPSSQLAENILKNQKDNISHLEIIGRHKHAHSQTMEPERVPPIGIMSF